MTEPTRETAVFVRIENRHGHPYLVVSTAIREEPRPNPGCYVGGILADDRESMLADLEMSGHFDKTDGHVVGFAANYYSPMFIDQRRAKGMHVMLRRINTALSKAEAYEIGDCFMAFAKAIGAKYTVLRTGPGSFDFAWTTVEAGREYLRRVVAEEGSKIRLAA